MERVDRFLLPEQNIFEKGKTETRGRDDFVCLHDCFFLNEVTNAHSCLIWLVRRIFHFGGGIAYLR